MTVSDSRENRVVQRHVLTMRNVMGIVVPVQSNALNVVRMEMIVVLLVMANVVQATLIQTVLNVHVLAVHRLINPVLETMVNVRRSIVHQAVATAEVVVVTALTAHKIADQIAHQVMAIVHVLAVHRLINPVLDLIVSKRVLTDHVSVANAKVAAVTVL